MLTKKLKHIFPNDGLMVIYHGTIRKQLPSTNPRMQEPTLYSAEHDGKKPWETKILAHILHLWNISLYTFDLNMVNY